MLKISPNKQGSKVWLRTQTRHSDSQLCAPHSYHKAGFGTFSPSRCFNMNIASIRESLAGSLLAFFIPPSVSRLLFPLHTFLTFSV